MRFATVCLLLTFAIPANVSAQETDPGVTSGDAVGQTVTELMAKGYEIKAAVPNGTKFMVFLQKDKSAVVCEFATLAKSQCGVLK
jgi:hypothetical protein